MKKAIFGFAALLMGICLNATPTGQVIKYNGGPFGFKSVYQEGTHYLECKDPGWTRCRWTNIPSEHLEILESIDEFVNEQLDQGNTSGNGSISGVDFIWSGFDAQNVEIEFGDFGFNSDEY